MNATEQKKPTKPSDLKALGKVKIKDLKTYC